MNSSLHVLIVEDSEDDMLFVLRELHRGGYTLDSLRVETADEMQDALDRQSWDLVIADYTLPTFSAPEALHLLLQSQQPDLPFIIVSGTVGEEIAVAAMKTGAHDYITKGHLARLVPAVERELREAEERKKRHQAERLLRESEERFRQLAENIPESVFWMSDPQGMQLLYVSPAYEQIWGRSCEQLYLNPIEWWEAVHPEERQQIQSNFLKQAWLGRYDEEYRIIRPDGSVRWIRDRGFPIRDASGNVYRVVGIADDITEKKQLESQFLRTQRLESLGTLASGIAHDFNNILTPILAIAPLLSQDIPSLNPQTQQLLHMIEENAKRGAALVKQILTFARGLEGENRVPVQVKHLLKELVQVIRRIFPKSITVRPSFSSELWLVSANATQLEQVFINLAINARDAMPQGGILSISTENRIIDATFSRMYPNLKVGAYIVITFADTGTGISPEHIDRIFDPFFTTKAIGEGTGLGLSSTLGIINNHDGVITVQSEMGKGTQFQILLPAIQDTEIPIAEPQLLPMGQGELILLVDDEVNIRKTLKLTLERHNYTVLMATDGIDAIAIYAQHHTEIKAVLIDIMMPGMGGEAAIQALQKFNPHVKIIACSGIATPETLPKTFGIQAFLPKPFTADVLLQTLYTVLAE